MEKGKYSPFWGLLPYEDYGQRQAHNKTNGHAVHQPSMLIGGTHTTFCQQLTLPPFSLSEAQNCRLTISSQTQPPNAPEQTRQSMSPPPPSWRTPAAPHLDVCDVRSGDDLLKIAQGVGLGERVDELVLDDGLLNLHPGHAKVRNELLERAVALGGLDNLRVSFSGGIKVVKK